jgi:hypothetical protein
MSLHIPKIYERWTAPVQIDLGSTAQTVDGIAAKVQQIALITESLPVTLKAVSDKVDVVQATTTTVKDSLTDARIDINNAAAAAKAQIDATEQSLKAALVATGDDIVKRVLAAQSSVGGQINDRSAPLVRALIQAKAIALDATPGEVYKGPVAKYKGWLKDDVALDQLGKSTTAAQAVIANAPDLKARFQATFARFTSNTLPDRGRRYAEMDRLAHDLVDHLK